MKKDWHVKWLASVVAFSLALLFLYADGSFGEVAEGPGFWVMISVVIALVSGAAGFYFWSLEQKEVRPAKK